jgi:predicted DNA-binding protein (UPF0251 family)
MRRQSFGKAQLTAKVKKQEQMLQNNDRKLTQQKSISLTMSEVENMRHKTLLGNVELTQQEAAELKQLKQKIREVRRVSKQRHDIPIDR